MVGRQRSRNWGYSKSMDFSDVYLVSRKLQTVEQSRLDELETWLKHPLPLGYREYMSQLGVGGLCDYLYVDSPEVIQKSQDDHYEHIDFHYEEFYDDQLHILSFEDALKSIRVGRSMVGDIIIYTPELDGNLYVLAQSYILKIEGGFFTPFHWTHEGKIISVYSWEINFLYFTPLQHRSSFWFNEVKNLNEDRLIRHILDFWSIAKKHIEVSGNSIKIFCRGCDGIFSIHRSVGENSVNLSVDFDKDHLAIVESFVQTLEPWGFAVVWKQ
jgi:hypothetical protein